MWHNSLPVLETGNITKQQKQKSDYNWRSKFYRDLETPRRDLGWQIIFNSEGTGWVEMVHLFILVPSALGLVEIYTSYCRETSGLRRLHISELSPWRMCVVGVGGRVLCHSPNGSCLICVASALTTAWGSFRVLLLILISVSSWSAILQSGVCLK